MPSGAPDDDGSRSDPESAWPEVDRRANGDRRDAPTRFFGVPWARGRRQRGRRHGETENIYVDVYSRGDVMLMLAIFVLNIGDALFTLMWLQRGGGEGNPAMQYMLEIGNGAFLIQKCFVVGLWLVVLMIHRHFRVARIGLWSALSVYSLLIVYHIILVTSGVDPVIRDEPPAAAPTQHGSSDKPAEQYGERRLHSQDSIAEAERL